MSTVYNWRLKHFCFNFMEAFYRVGIFTMVSFTLNFGVNHYLWMGMYALIYLAMTLETEKKGVLNANREKTRIIIFGFSRQEHTSWMRRAIDY